MGLIGKVRELSHFTLTGRTDKGKERGKAMVAESHFDSLLFNQDTYFMHNSKEFGILYCEETGWTVST